MRYTERHKEQVGARIVEAAAEALREHGIDGVSIPAMMKQVGLTHGAFYCHFRDRDELVAEAVRFAADRTAERVLDSPGDDAPAMLRRYLSPQHRDHPERGCVLAALGTEGRRQGPAVRRAFAYVARGFVRHVQRRLHPKLPPDALRDDALQLAARMIGALVLSRLVDDEALSARILHAARAV
jgi:TetR/AcrR family transcriptional repressor of nem operon